jgi:hypothetical protein
MHAWEHASGKCQTQTTPGDHKIKKKKKTQIYLGPLSGRPNKQGTGAHSNTTCPLRSTRCQFFNLPRKIHWCTPRNRSQSTRIPPLPERPYMDPVHGRNRHGARSAESLGAMHRVQPNSPGHDHADPILHWYAHAFSKSVEARNRQCPNGV